MKQYCFSVKYISTFVEYKYHLLPIMKKTQLIPIKLLLSVSAVVNAQNASRPQISSCSWWMIWDGRIRPAFLDPKTHYK